MSTDLTTFESYPAFALFLCGNMETFTSADGKDTLTRTKSDCPVWAKSLIYSVKADNGEIYNALEVISDAVEDDIDDIASDVVADTYTSDLLDWLVTDRSRCALVDDAVGELGWSSLTEAISQAQVIFRDALVRELYARLEAEERIRPAREVFDEKFQEALDSHGYSEEDVLSSLSEDFITDAYLRDINPVNAARTAAVQIKAAQEKQSND